MTSRWTAHTAALCATPLPCVTIRKGRRCVCEAFCELCDGGDEADAAAIAARLRLAPVHDAGCQAARLAQIEAIAQRLATGLDARLLCWCSPRRCHADGISRCGRRHARTRSSSSSAASGAVEDGGGLGGDAARGASSVQRAGLPPEGISTGRVRQSRVHQMRVGRGSGRTDMGVSNGLCVCSLVTLVVLCVFHLLRFVCLVVRGE